MNEKEIIDKLKRRLYGFPIGIKDINNKELLLGDRISFPYKDTTEYGIIEYDLENNKYIIWLDKIIPELNENNYFIINLDKIPTFEIRYHYSYLYYNEYKDLNGKEFFTKILYLYEQGEIVISDLEYKYIKTYLETI